MCTRNDCKIIVNTPDAHACIKGKLTDMHKLDQNRGNLHLYKIHSNLSVFGQNIVAEKVD